MQLMDDTVRWKIIDDLSFCFFSYATMLVMLCCGVLLSYVTLRCCAC